MKLVIPTNNKKGLGAGVAQHFGRCLTYTFLNEKGEVLEIIDNVSEHMGGVGLPPELMRENGADILLCQDIGPRAIDLCYKLGIEVYVCRAKSVKKIFQIWKEGKIKKAGPRDACQQHKK